MTEFLATFQVAYLAPSVFTGLKPCALFWWAFSPQTADDCDIAGRVAGAPASGKPPFKPSFKKAWDLPYFHPALFEAEGSDRLQSGLEGPAWQVFPHDFPRMQRPDRSSCVST